MADLDPALSFDPANASPDMFRLIADNLPQLAWMADADGQPLWYNRRWFDYTGIEPSHMAAHGWASVISPDRVEAVQQLWTAALDRGQPWEDLIPLRGADGDYRQFLSRASPLRDEAGAVTHWFGTSTDITGQLAAQAELTTSQARLEAALEASQTGTFFWDMRSNRLDWDDALDRLFGLSAGQSARCLDQFVAMVHPDERAELLEHCQRCIEDGADFEMEFRILRPDGQVRWLYDRGKTKLGTDGRPAVMSGACVDITDRRRSEESALTSARELEAIYQAAPVGLTVVDQHRRFVRINQRLAEINGLSPEEHVGRTLREILPQVADQGEAALERVLAGEEIWGLEISGRTPAQPGVVRTWRENWIPMRGEDGSIIGAAISAEEITASREAARQLELSEQRFRAAIDAVAGVLWTNSPDGRMVGEQPGWAALTGQSTEEYQGYGWSEAVHPADLAETLEVWQRAVAERGTYEVRHRVRRHDGEWREFSAHAIPMFDEHGQVREWVGVHTDITDQLGADAALRRSEERYRALFESMEQGFCVVEVQFDGDTAVDHRFLEINPAFSKQSGLSADVLGKSIKSAVPDLEQSWFDHYGAIARTGVSQRFVERAGPLHRWFEVYAFRIGDPAHNHVAVLFTDVTDRVTQEENLKLRLNAIPQMVWSTLPDGFHDFYNDRWYEYTGTPHGSTDGEGWNGMFHPDDQDRAMERWRQSLTSGEPYEIEYRLRHHSGDYRWVLGRALPVRDEDGQIIRWMGTCTDIDEGIRARTALEESEATLRAVIESMPVGLMFADASGKLTGRNQRIGDILGHEPQLSDSPDDYEADFKAYHPDGRPVASEDYPLARIIAGQGGRPELECQVVRGDGGLRWVRYVAAPIEDGAGNLVGGVVASIDIDREKRLAEGLEREVEKVIAEREAAQDALRQSQKLEAMGQLTGGVAHDFNNLLTPIIGSLDLLHRKEVGDARTRRLIDGALQSAERAKTLVQRLLAFARRQPLQPTAVEVGRIVEDMADLIASTSGPRIKVAVSVAPELPPAHADGNQLEMALLNLSVNARDAMPEGGQLSIDVRQADARAADLPGLMTRPHIVLSVSDTGVGMDDETLARCIEPFYSTKGIGKGTGLGLSMVHGLAAQLGGALRINSKEGAGTSIELWLPVSSELLEGKASSRSAAERDGEGTVLLVDDEDLVRDSTSSMLSDLGFRVVEASSAEQALTLIKNGLLPDMLVTDHLMPGLSGTDLAVRLRARLPSLPVLIVSGYAEADQLMPAFPRLTKPFRQADLSAAVSALKGEVAPATDRA